MNIILFGPPGAGKGTQTNNIIKNFNLFKISAGELLRAESENSTPLGNQIKSVLEKGLFVSDDLFNGLVEKMLANKKYYNRLIFDGYPRNLDQAINLDEKLKKYNQKISTVLYLNVDKDIISKRILGRQSCSKCGLIFNAYFNPPTADNHSCDKKFLVKRLDDNESAVMNRIEIYLKKTLPLLNFYKKQNLLHEINGMKKIHQIYEEIQGIISTLET